MSMHMDSTYAFKLRRQRLTKVHMLIYTVCWGGTCESGKLAVRPGHACKYMFQAKIHALTSYLPYGTITQEPLSNTFFSFSFALHAPSYSFLDQITHTPPNTSHPFPQRSACCIQHQHWQGSYQSVNGIHDNLLKDPLHCRVACLSPPSQMQFRSNETLECACRALGNWGHIHRSWFHSGQDPCSPDIPMAHAKSVQEKAIHNSLWDEILVERQVYGRSGSPTPCGGRSFVSRPSR